MKGPNGWKISWHFSSVGEFHFHRFWASHLRHEQLLRKSPPTDERFQRMEDQLALFIRWRIFFSSFLGVVLDAMNNSFESTLGAHASGVLVWLPRRSTPEACAPRLSSFPGVAREATPYILYSPCWFGIQVLACWI
jgi:hypothetical protein